MNSTTTYVFQHREGPVAVVPCGADVSATDALRAYLSECADAGFSPRYCDAAAWAF